MKHPTHHAVKKYPSECVFLHFIYCCRGNITVCYSSSQLMGKLVTHSSSALILRGAELRFLFITHGNLCCTFPVKLSPIVNPFLSDRLPFIGLVQKSNRCGSVSYLPSRTCSADVLGILQCLIVVLALSQKQVYCMNGPRLNQ